MSKLPLEGVVKFKEKKNSIRIRHKNLKGIMLIVRDRGRPLSDAGKGLRPVCETCTVEHTYKTYHFQLDDEGCILVSEGVYDQLAKMPDKAGFDIANVIHNPPNQLIAVNKETLKAKVHDPGSVQEERIHAYGKDS